MTENKTRTILLVEDEAIIAMNQERILKKHGFNVIKAFSGETALEIIQSDPAIYLILMDIDLGKGMDGTEAATEILKKFDVPIVFLTSHSEKEYVEKVKKITKYGYVLKNSGEFVLIESIHMARKLHNAHTQLEKEKQDSDFREKYLQSIFRTVPTGISVLKDRVIEKVNNHLCLMTGYAENELLGRSTQFLYLNSEDYEFYKQEKYRQFDDRGTGSIETRWVRKDGSVIDILLYSSPVDLNDYSHGIVITVLDITERKRAELKQMKSEKKFRKIFNNLNIAVQGYYKDGTVHYWNRASENLYGYTREEAVSSNLFDLIIPENMTGDVKKAVNRMFHTEKPLPAEELELKCKDGSTVPVLSNHTVINISDDIKELYCIDIDMTLIKQYEEDLKKSSRNNANILDELQHRVKNSFMLINSMMNLMMNADRTEQEYSLLSDIGLKISAVSELYSLLYVTNSINSVSLDEYLTKLIENFKLTTDDISFHSELRPLTVSAKSAIPIGLIVSEFITNSHKHAFPSSSQQEIHISLMITENGGTIHYRDNGRGLTEDFDPESSNTLGFSLIKGLTEQIEGSLSIKKGRGFSAQLDFPLT